MGNREDAKGFFFLDEEGKRTDASVSLDGDFVKVEIPDGAAYFCMGYENLPTHNLYNAAGYLASPFRVKL